MNIQEKLYKINVKLSNIQFKKIKINYHIKTGIILKIDKKTLHGRIPHELLLTAR